MKILVFGGTGATGRHLILELLNHGHSVHAVVRSKDRLENCLIDIDASVRERLDQLSVTVKSVAEVSARELDPLLAECHGVASCLGHNLTLKGIFGKPRNLVSGTIQIVCEVLNRQNQRNLKPLVLMNTTANQNIKIEERRSKVDTIFIKALRSILPPQRDNEDAAKYLCDSVGVQNENVRWVVVRPDTLTNEDHVTEYKVFPSPIRSPIFNPGKTSRINVATFMARLLEDHEYFESWSGQMPVIYN